MKTNQFKPFAVVTAIAVSVPAWARNVSVTSFDKATGDAVLAISAAEAGDGDKALIAAWANGDKGNDPLNWTEYADAGTVAAADVSKSYQIPAKWRTKSGSVRFFLMSGPKPYGTRYDYITRPNCDDGGLYIDTGIVPDKTIDITVKAQSPDTDNFSPWGSTDVCINPTSNSDDPYFFSFLGVSHPGIHYTGVTSLSRTDKNVFGEGPARMTTSPRTFRMCRDGIYIDGYRHLGPFKDSELTSTPTRNLALFGRNGSWKQKDKTCSIYFATIVTNGVTARDLVPVASPGGYVQMWDRVTRSYIGRSGTQRKELAFIAGNDIGPYPTDCGSVESVSDALGLGPAIAIAGTDTRTRSVTVSLSSDHDDGMLFAVAGASDAGTAYSSWTTNMLVQKVGAGTNSVIVALPREWWRSRYNVRFAWRSLAGRQYDYDVSYIHADGSGGQTNFCRTGWIPTTNTTISVNARTAIDAAPFGISSTFMLFLNGGATPKFYYGCFESAGYNESAGDWNNGVACNSPSAFAQAYHEWKLGPTEARVDDVVRWQLSGAKSTTVAANICLPFRADSRLNDEVVQKVGNVEVKAAKIWEGDILVRDFAPCVSTNGVPGFYDNVRGQFYPSVTSKPFVAGDVVVADGDFVSWSAAQTLSIGFVITFR